ncbi:hypothetical protein [Reichenbachiella sp. MALMAid0571]|uniref:hypothetical protein n=1 Tax=Reichenbachiella sp. MALMAid0571 TaxID=3143939 RepID=UPI0032DF33B0
MDSNFDIFVEHWHQIAIIWSQIALAFAGIILAYYLLIFTTRNSIAEKYKFISLNEIKYFWYTALSLTISFTFFLNAIMVKKHSTAHNFDLTVKTILSLGIGFLIGYVINTYLNVYYPFTLEKKLSALRFKKRISPESKKEMRLLNEDQEDIHLSEMMIAEENAFAYDYDVWIDDETGYKLIEKYEGNLHALICDKCRFRTLKEYKEEVESSLVSGEPDSIVKYYKCSYCGHLEEKVSEISKLQANAQ